MSNPLDGYELERRLTPSRGHRGCESHELFINGEQFKFPSGATAGWTQGGILRAFLESLGATVKETNSQRF